MKMKLPNPLRDYSSFLNTLLILILLIVGFVIRILGISVGLPNTPDPREILIAEDIINLINFSAPPEIYNWPGTAWFYLIAFVGKVLSIFGLEITETLVIWLARFINVLLSTGTIWLTYCLGTRCYNKRVGQIAAAFLTVAMLHATNESRFALVDIPATFCVTLFLWVTAKDTDLTLRSCIWLGVVSGIAIAVKFPTVFVLLSFVVFIQTERFYRKFAMISGVCALTFTVVCPYWLIDILSSDWNHFFDDFWYESKHYHRGHFGLFATGDTGWVNRFLYLWILLKWGVGLPLASLIVIAIVFAIAKLIKLDKALPNYNENARKGFFMLAFVIPYLLFIGTFKVSFTRHLLILYPVLTILVAALLIAVDKRIGVVIGGAIWVYSLIYSIAFASVMVSQPIGQEASEWVSENLPHDSSLSHAPEILFDWLIPDFDIELTDEEAKWAFVIYPNLQLFQKYEQNPNAYEEIDWYPLKAVDIEGTLKYYDKIFGESSRYELQKTFQRVPKFFGVRVSDRNAPFPMNALIHPEIRLYRRVE